jgi:ribose transport system ATP-binding protein
MSSSGPAFLEMSGIHKRFGATLALQDVDFQVNKGEIHALVGENGAGKSTLMKILSGVHRPDGGTLRLDGRVFRPRDPLEARRRGVGMIYQELTLAPHLSVEENILLGQEPSTCGFIHRSRVRHAATEALARLRHSEIPPDRRISDLSISEQQLVEIARSLTAGCRVLVLDEPTSSLNQKDTKRLFEIIRELRNQGLAIVYISHFIEEVKTVSDRVTVLRDGNAVGTSQTAAVTLDEIVQLMVGRNVKDMYPHSTRSRGAPVLEVDKLGGLDKLYRASLTLHRGEVLGIAGLVGAGRTELLRIIFGLDPVKAGKIKVGLVAGPASPLRRWRQGLGYLSENRKEEGLAVSMNLADNLTLTNLNAYGKGWLLSPKKQHRAARKWIERLDIRSTGPEQRVMDISGGNQQKIALARLLEHDVDVLILDEPTRGIDVAAKAKIYQIIDQLAAGGDRQGIPQKAVLMSSSYLPELLGVCDRIAVMSRGRLGPALDTRQWSEERLMQEATGQISEHLEEEASRKVKTYGE